MTRIMSKEAIQNLNRRKPNRVDVPRFSDCIEQSTFFGKQKAQNKEFFCASQNDVNNALETAVDSTELTLILTVSENQIMMISEPCKVIAFGNGTVMCNNCKITACENVVAMNFVKPIDIVFLNEHMKTLNKAEIQVYIV